MKLVYFKATLLFLITLTVQNVSGQLPQPTDLRHLRQQLQSPVLDKHFVGFSLYDLDEQKYVMGKNQDRHFTPASHTKVFTLYNTLTLLSDSIPGLAYVEKGDSLIFWGTGDPSFLHPELDNGRVYNFLKETDKKLFFVPSSPQEPFYRAGWAIDDYDYSYQAELSDFPIYGNLVRFHNSSEGVKADPGYFQHSLQWTPPDSTVSNRIHRHFHRNLFQISPSALTKNFSIQKPFRTGDSLIVRLLADTLKKRVNLLAERELPEDVEIYYSIPTRQALRAMMLPSDNFIAEQLQMVASFVKYGSFRTIDLRAFLQQHYDLSLPDSIQLRDGSGLSTYNQITPRSMIEILRRITELIPNREQRHYLFPAGGLEGTLKNVYPTPGGRPFVWAKTGTIHSVHCQSGYLTTKSGKHYIFSFLNNNFLGSSTPVRKEMVRVITYIYENF